jgi:hypothetical protein
MSVVAVAVKREKSGILEKYYRASAENITVERRLLNAGDEPSASPPEMLAALLSTVFDTTVEDLRRSFAAGLIPAASPGSGPAAEPGSGPAADAGEAGSGSASPLVLSRSLVSLPKEKAAAFIERFNGLLKEIDAEDQGGGGAESYGCTVAFYPRVKAGGAQAPEEKNMGRG